MSVSRQLLANGLVRTGSVRLLHWWGTWKQLLVLNYHRIGDGTQTPWDWDLWSASQADFDWQIRYLKQNFDIITPEDLPQVATDRSGQHILITFDDGYRDNYELAFPVLKSHGVSATFFLATGFLDQPRASWWDEIAWMVRQMLSRTSQPITWPATGWLSESLAIDPVHPLPAIRKLLKLYKSLSGERAAELLPALASDLGCGRCPAELAAEEWMTWDMAREMRASGMHFGPHTVNHPILARLSPAQQLWEITNSTRRVTEELGSRPEIFSYPVGGATSCSATTWSILEQEGFRWAFRFGIGHHDEPLAQPLQIPRIPVEREYDREFFESLVTWPRLFA